MGELLHKVQQLPEGRPVDLHGDVPAVKDDAVLVVVNIGGILEEPFAVVDGDGDDPVVPPGGMVHPARVALIFPAELALGVAALGGGLGGGDGPGVLLRLGEVDGDVQIAVLRGSHPLHIPGDAVTADVVRVLAEPVIPVRRLLPALGAARPKFPYDRAGPGRQDAHEPGVQQITAGNVVPDDAPRRGIVQQSTQDLLQRGIPQGFLRLPEAVQLQRRQQLVPGPDPVRLFDQLPLYGVLHQRRDVCAYVLHFICLLTPISRRPRDGWTARGTVPRP